MVALLLSACSSSQVHVQPAASLKTISSNVALTVDGDGVDPAVVEGLTRYLKAKLILAGFDLTDSTDSLRLLVDLHSFDPGSAATRLTVGFGAGRESLLYTARYLDRDRHVLAEMEGHEYFTGAEPQFNFEYGPATTMGGAETVQSVLVREAAKHIVKLGLGNK